MSMAQAKKRGPKGTSGVSTNDNDHDNNHSIRINNTSTTNIDTNNKHLTH